MNQHNNHHQMQYRKHTMAVLMLVAGFLLLFAVNYTPKEVKPDSGLLSPDKLYPTNINEEYDYTDRIIIDPLVIDIINKTFYSAEKETVILLDYKMTGDKIRIFNYTIPKMESNNKDSVTFYYDTNIPVKMSIHNHIYTCNPSTEDLNNPDSIMCIYCPDKETILIYIKETKETLYYKIK